MNRYNLVLPSSFRRFFLIAVRFFYYFRVEESDHDNKRCSEKIEQEIVNFHLNRFGLSISSSYRARRSYWQLARAFTTLIVELLLLFPIIKLD